MKTYIIHRVDGGIEIMQTVFDPLEMIAKWAPKRREEITGTYREIQKEDIPTDRSQRNKWYDTGTSIEVRE